jgi:formylmethanofuran dehydrogenase subunit E
MIYLIVAREILEIAAILFLLFKVEQLFKFRHEVFEVTSRQHDVNVRLLRALTTEQLSLYNAPITCNKCGKPVPKDVVRKYDGTLLCPFCKEAVTVN